MAKVTNIGSGYYYDLDCGHVLNDFDVEWAPKKGFEVDCPVCADNEKRVKAARVEVLEIISVSLNADRTYDERTIDTMRLIDKLIEASQ